MTKIGGLSAKQRVAAAMLAGGATGRDTASKICVSEDTVSRWRRVPQFQSAVAHLIGEAEVVALESLHSLRLAAVERLGELVRSKTELVALRAIGEVLDRTTQPIAERGEAGIGPENDFQAFMQVIRSQSPNNKKADIQ